jgi:hypothetical protein
MHQFAGEHNMAVWYAHMDVEQAFAQFKAQFSHMADKRAEHAVAKAQTKDSMTAFAELTHEVNGEPRIISDPPLIEPVEELFPEVGARQMTEAVLTLAGLLLITRGAYDLIR